MAEGVSLLTQGVVARATVASPQLFTAGQVLEAIVLGRGPDGMTALRLGNVLVSAQLPQPFPSGTTLQLQVVSGGATPQLAIIGQPQVTAPLPAPAPVPEPMGLVLVLQGATTAVGLPVAVRPAVGAATGASPPTVTVASVPVTTVVQQEPVSNAPDSGRAGAVQLDRMTPRAVGPVAPSAATIEGEAPAVRVVPPPTTGGSVSANGESLQAINARSVSTTSATVLSPASAGTESPTVPVSARPAPALPLPGAGSPVLPVHGPIAAPAQGTAPVLPINASTPPTATAPGPVTPSMTPIVVEASATSPFPAATVPSALAAGSAPPSPAPVSPIVANPSPVQVAGAPPSAPPLLVATIPPVAGQADVAPSAPPVTIPAVPETHSLLVAQGTARPAASMADLSRPASNPSPKTTAAVSPSASSSPATPQAALAQMVPEALAKQNTIAPLFASLAAALAKSVAMPEPVVRAAMQLLAQRVAVPPTGPTASALEAAISKSGLYLEAALARGVAAPDVKAGLLSLKEALTTWLGGNPAPVQMAHRVTPPLRGMPPRAELAEQPLLPDLPREAGRLLHNQADAALSRVKLMQFASLPDADAARGAGPELRMELPLLIGGELAMAQFQVFRDGARRHAEAKRGWTMRFAMNFSGTGEVGAEVGLLGRTVNVALWASEPDTAERLQAALPELAPALASIGLDAGSIRLRSAPPTPERPASGHFVDSLS